MSRLLTWAFALGWAAVLLSGAHHGWREHQRRETQQRSVEQADEQAFEAQIQEALLGLHRDPDWHQGSGLPSHLDLQVVNRWRESPSCAHPTGPPGLAARSVLVSLQKDGQPWRQAELRPLAPSWSRGLQQPDQGPFHSPLDSVPQGPVEYRHGRLRAGSYGELAVAAGQTLTLCPDSQGNSDFRLHGLRLEPGATLQVSTTPDRPIVIFFERRLELRGHNRVHWDDAAGPAALLQLYGGPAAQAHLQDSHQLSLVLSVPSLTIENSTLSGAAACRHWSGDGRVEFEPDLTGVSLQGLGPWTRR